LVLRKLLLETQQHAWQEQTIEIAAVDGDRLRAELIALKRPSCVINGEVAPREE